MSRAELEDFHVTGRVRCNISTMNYSRAGEATLSNPEDRVADEETAKTQFALPDELQAKVLGYLPLRDRFRLETVCRQWQRCMYLEMECLHLRFYPVVTQQYTLTITNLGKITCSSTEELPTVLHKLRRSKVSHLTFGIDGEILDIGLFYLIADIASKATNVVLDYGITFILTNLVTLCDIIGPYITTFQLIRHCERAGFEDFEAFVNSLARMKRLKNVTSNWLELIFTCLNSLPANSLPYFQEIDLRCCHDHWKLWEHFKSLYGAQMKKIAFDSDLLLHDEGEVMSLWKDLAPFVNLQHLDFGFYLGDCNWTALAEGLEVISISCPLLTSLGLHQEVFIGDGFVTTLTEVQKLFVAIGKMKILEKLELFFIFHFDNSREISSEENLDLFTLLENKSNITHLKCSVTLFQVFNQAIGIDCGIYGSLNVAMPNLRHLDVCCLASELDDFVGFQRMQTIRLFYFPSAKASGSAENSLIRILKSSPALRSIEICPMLAQVSSPALRCIEIRSMFAQVSEALFGAIIEVAELQMEKHIDFIAELQAPDESQKAWEALKHLAPRNLTLAFENLSNSD